MNILLSVLFILVASGYLLASGIKYFAESVRFFRLWKRARLLRKHKSIAEAVENKDQKEIYLKSKSVKTQP